MTSANYTFDRSQIKILLLENVHQKAVDNLKENGFTNIEYIDRALAEDEFCEKIKDVHMVGLRSKTKLTKKVLAHANKLRVVGTFSVGTNQIDLETTGAMGIPVFNAPFSSTRSVAELIMAEIVWCFRGISEKNIGAHLGHWRKSVKNSFEVRAKNLGIVGYGHIGSQVSILASAFGMHVYYYDIEKKLPFGNAREVGSLEELLEISDAVTLHVPETELTKGMINKETLKHMKDGSFLLNASRGTVVDIDAVVERLKSGKLLGGAFDVYPNEPKSPQETFVSPLREFENVILTPHIGGTTKEAQSNIGLEVADKLIKYANEGTTLSAVNFPEVNLPAHEGMHRVLHIHQNVPGVMSNLNSVFSKHDVNIFGQYLQTNEKIGYVVVDVGPKFQPEFFEEIKNVPGTINARILS